MSGRDRLWLSTWVWTLRRTIGEDDCTLALPDLLDRDAIPGDVQYMAALLAAVRHLNESPPHGPTAVELAAFTPRLIRSFHDAEQAAAHWLAAMGCTSVRLTAPGADGGVDVVSEEVVAQVKAEMVPTGRPVIQQLAGIAALEGKQAAVFSLAGFTAEAVQWADRARVALLRFNLQGVPEAANEAAGRWT